MASATLASSSAFAKCSLTHRQNPLSFSLSKPNCSFLSPSLPPSSLSLSRPSLDPATPQTQRPTFKSQAKLTQEQYIKILKSISPYGEDVDLKEIAAKIYKRRNKPKRRLGSADFFAVVMIGGRQYIVIPGRWIHTQRLKGANVNDKIVLNKVLLVGAKDKTYVGYPLVTNCVVHAVVEEQLLDDKVIVFKYKKKKNYSRNIGHRQPITRIRITGITGYEDYPASTLLDTADVTDS